jgi:hypothetical protein
MPIANMRPALGKAGLSSPISALVVLINIGANSHERPIKSIHVRRGISPLVDAALSHTE